MTGCPTRRCDCARAHHAESLRRSAQIITGAFISVLVHLIGSTLRLHNVGPNRNLQPGVTAQPHPTWADAPR